MEERREAHVVDIPAGEESTSSAAVSISALKHHPLAEISQSPGHLLLLKLWQREDDLLGRRIAATETLIQAARRQVFRLCCLFFAFHGIFLTVLFVGAEEGACDARRRWWLPCLLSLSTSLVVAGAVHRSVRQFWASDRRLKRERGEARAIGRCMLELRMKGASFDLNKVPVVGGNRRMKSAGDEMRWKLLRWVRQNAVSVSLLCFTAGVVPAGKFMLCG